MKIRNSNEELTTSVKKLIGVGNFKVVGINLSQEEIDELDFPFSDGDTTSIEFGGKEYTKLSFYVYNKEFDIKNRLVFLLSKDEVVSQNGNKKYINDIGQSSYGKSKEEVLGRKSRNGQTFIKDINIRPAKEGETELLEFLICWFNIKNFVTKKDLKDNPDAKPDTIVIDFNKLVDGDVTELREYHKQAIDNEVKLLLYNKNNYINVYNRYFDRAYNGLSNFARYAKNQENSGYPIADYGCYHIGDFIEYSEKFTPMRPDKDDNNVEEDVDF